MSSTAQKTLQIVCQALAFLFRNRSNAYQEFLQALFISRQTYPIAYNKWIQEQLVDILQLPELYKQLAHLFEIKHFEGGEILEKAQAVEHLLEVYAPEIVVK